MAQKKKTPAPKPSNVVPLKAEKKPEMFIRIVEHEMKPGDAYRGYQAEVVEVLGDKVISRRLVDKPNLFEYAQSHAIDLVDPRNYVNPVKAHELA